MTADYNFGIAKIIVTNYFLENAWTDWNDDRTCEECDECQRSNGCVNFGVKRTRKCETCDPNANINVCGVLPEEPCVLVERELICEDFGNIFNSSYSHFLYLKCFEYVTKLGNVHYLRRIKLSFGKLFAQ